MRTNSATQKELKRQLRLAVDAQKQALQRFKEVIREIPSGLPHPDGSERIHQASRELTDAHGAVVALLMKLNRSSMGDDSKGNKLQR